MACPQDDFKMSRATVTQAPHSTPPVSSGTTANFQNYLPKLGHGKSSICRRPCADVHSTIVSKPVD